MVPGLKRLVETLSLLEEVREALNDAHMRRLPSAVGTPTSYASSASRRERGQLCSSVVTGAIRQLMHDMHTSPFLRSLSQPPRLLPVPGVEGAASPRAGLSPRSPASQRRMLPASPQSGTAPQSGAARALSLADGGRATDDRQALVQQVERLTHQLQESMSFYTGRVSTLKTTLESHKNAVAERLERDANQVQRLCAALLAVLVTLIEGPLEPVSGSALTMLDMEDSADSETQRELRLLDLLDRVREALR